MTGAASEPPGGWYPGSRLERIRDSHSYGFVLVLVAVSLVFAATASGGAWSGSVLLVLEAVTLVVAMWTSGVARADSRTSLVIVVVATGVAVANAVWAGTVLSAATGLLSAALVIVTGAVVGIGVADQRAVNTRSVLGAVSVYLLLGMLFTFVYDATATIGSGSFFAQGTDGDRPIRVYFSYVTLATLGYGDYTPAGTFGRLFAVIEALVGQLYLVTVVALLVSRLRVRAEETA